MFQGCDARATGRNDSVTGSVDDDGMTRYKYVNSMCYISCWLPAEYARCNPITKLNLRLYAKSKSECKTNKHKLAEISVT